MAETAVIKRDRRHPAEGTVSREDVSAAKDDSEAQPQTQNVVPISEQDVAAIADRIRDTSRIHLAYSWACWDAGGGGQRPQQLAEASEDEALSVCVSEGQSGTENGQDIDTTLTRPLSEWPEWYSMMGAAEKAVAYIGLPSDAGYEMAEDLGREWHTVYDMMDCWTYFRPAQDWFDERRECDLANMVDTFMCTDERIADYAEHRYGRRPDVLHNSTKLTPRTFPREGCCGIDHDPLDAEYDVVYCGHLRCDWMDRQVLRELADSKLRLLMIGNVSPEYAVQHENIDYTGVVPNDELADYLQKAKVGIVPFEDLPLSEYVDPIKNYDYAAMGLPVIGRCVPAIDRAPHSVCYDHRDELVLGALYFTQNASVDMAIAQRDWARQHTHEQRYQQYADILRREGAW